MKLTHASSYALHAVIFMVQQRNNRPVASHNIAEACNIPDRFLLKVLKWLVDEGVLRSVKGPNGGYALARDASEISLLEVIEAVDGPIHGLAPFEEEGSTALHARLEAVCQQSAEVLRRYLATVHLSDLVGPGPLFAGDNRAGKEAD
jgi:Rrf2 family protein